VRDARPRHRFRLYGEDGPRVGSKPESMAAIKLRVSQYFVEKGETAPHIMRAPYKAITDNRWGRLATAAMRGARSQFRPDG